MDGIMGYVENCVQTTNGQMSVDIDVEPGFEFSSSLFEDSKMSVVSTEDRERAMYRLRDNVGKFRPYWLIPERFERVLFFNVSYDLAYPEGSPKSVLGSSLEASSVAAIKRYDGRVGLTVYSNGGVELDPNGNLGLNEGKVFDTLVPILVYQGAMMLDYLVEFRFYREKA